MHDMHCSVIASPRDSRWLAAWMNQEFPGGGITRTALVYDSKDAGDLSRAILDHAARPFHAVLVMVSNKSVGWAQRCLSEIAPVNVPAVAITQKLSAERIRQLLRSGARDFLTHDCGCEELKLRLWRLNDRARAASGSSSPLSTRHPLLSRFIGCSSAFLRQVERVPVMAQCDASVLILGETGTGKELGAQAIHYLSPRASRPWVAVNCGALPADLVESELFGHVRGAYTSAHQSHTGLITEAEGGTLFLDEVDSLPHAAQAKLLRFLQEKEYRPVGSTRVQRANVRIIAATNTELEIAAEQGRFRKDLFYRLNVLTLRLPALRERMEDLLPLAEHFVTHFAHEFQRPVKGLSTAAAERIAAYRWPGNVRELEHAIERAVLLCAGETIGTEDLDLPVSAPAGGADSFKAAKAKTIEEFERSYIQRMLQMSAGNITQAAQVAAKNRRAFWQLMRKHRIDAGKYRSGPGF